MIWTFMGVSIPVSLYIFIWVKAWSSWVDAFWVGNSVFLAEISDRIFGCFFALASVFILGLFVAGGFNLGYWIGQSIGSTCSQVWVKEGRTQMVSLRGADGISGRLFMYSGFIDQTSTYFYYTQTSDGGFQQQKHRPDSNTYVYEEDRTDGEMAWFSDQFENRSLRFIAIPGDETRVEFHIPKGSIQKKFELQ